MRLTVIVLLMTFTLMGCGEASFAPASMARLAQANIRFNHISIVATDMVKNAYSDDVSPEDMTTQLRRAITSKLSELQGDRVYNIGIKVTGYMLANPSVLTVSSPKSVLMLSVSVWNDSPDNKLMLPPSTVIAVDGLYGSALSIAKSQGSKDQRLAALTGRAGVEIAQYLARNAQSLEASTP